MKKQQKTKFNYSKVMKNHELYQPIVYGYNMYIFQHTFEDVSNFYAFNYGTCFFYLLKYCYKLKCYYIDKTLNYYLPDNFTVWQWTKNDKTSRITVTKKERNKYDL